MKKFNSMHTFLLAGLILTTIASCKKEEDDHHHDDSSDKSKPVITLSSPTYMQMYNNGDTVKIKGSLTDNSLHELLIKVVNSADNSVLFTETPTVHGLTSFSIDSRWKSSVADHTHAWVIVMAEDHSSNVASDTVKIHIMK